MTDSEYLRAIGLNVKLARNRKGISSMELCKMCGIDRSGLSKVELGKSNPHMLTLRKIANTLSVDVKELISV